jgi:hypothetical protein
MVGLLAESLSASDPHPIWRETVTKALASGLRRGNWEMQLGAEYENGSAVARTKEFTDEVVEVLRAMKPLMSAAGG